MNRRRLTACLSLCAWALALLPLGPGSAVARAQGGENNLWPVRVEQVDARGRVLSWQGAGPLAFSRGWPDGREVGGFRPFWLEWKGPEGARTVDILYPLFRYRLDAHGKRWSLLQLVNGSTASPESDGSAPASGGFDLWPFWFSRSTGNPDTSYEAFFPFVGVIKNRFGNDRMEWFLFPLYGRFQSGQRVTTTAPWPFVRRFSGEGQNGWSFWPLFGWRQQTGESRSQYAVWPLYYRQESRLSEATSSLSWGILPFYAAERSAEGDSQTWLWPFFGYLDRRSPTPYHETRWLWPLWVQGSGPDRSRQRWAPFYTHSISKAGEKTWILWPLWREEKWSEVGLDQSKRQFLYFLYWSLNQRRAGAPAGAPVANKTHLWPLFSSWDNGAGRAQVQVLSPLEVFFPHNDAIRATYSPLFALYRFERRAPGDTRHSALWDALTYASNAAAGSAELNVGPLLSVRSKPSEQKVSLFGGLIGMRRAPGERAWRAFLRLPGEATSPAASTSPTGTGTTAPLQPSSPTTASRP